MVKTTITASKKPKAATTTLSSIVDCYKKHIQSRGKGVDGELNSVQKVYKNAQQGKISYNDFWNRIVKGEHQRRMRKTTQSIVANALQSANILLKNYNTFEDLFDDVNSIVGNVDGVGQLTVYDISIRLGHLFSPRLRPTFVYLYRVPYESAKKLLGSTPKHIETHSVFSNFFGNLEPIYVEDILCICKCVFAKHPFTNCPSNQIPPYCLKKDVICMYIPKSNQSTKK